MGTRHHHYKVVISINQVCPRGFIMDLDSYIVHIDLTKITIHSRYFLIIERSNSSVQGFTSPKIGSKDVKLLGSCLLSASAAPSHEIQEQKTSPGQTETAPVSLCQGPQKWWLLASCWLKSTQFLSWTYLFGNEFNLCFTPWPTYGCFNLFSHCRWVFFHARARHTTCVTRVSGTPRVLPEFSTELRKL